MPRQTGRQFSPSTVMQEELRELSCGNASDSSVILHKKAVMPRPNSTHPMLVWMAIYRCANCCPSRAGPNRKLRELVMAKSTWEVYTPSECPGGALPSSTSVAFASTAAVATAETTMWSSDGNRVTRVADVSSLPASAALPEGGGLRLPFPPRCHTPTTHARDSLPPKPFGRHTAALCYLASCTPSTTRAAGLYLRSAPTRTSVSP